MKRIPSSKLKLSVRLGALALLAFLATAPRSYAHCDRIDGPVVSAARKALAETNVNPVLIWVQKSDEGEIKTAFQKTLAVRKLNPEALELADRYFFETLVRVHRAGEGAPYTGLKPADGPIGEAILAADVAVKTEDIKPVRALLASRMEQGLRESFHDVLRKKEFDPNNIPAGRDFVAAYVKYIHYVEGLHAAANPEAHAHGEDAEQTGPAEEGRTHNH